MQPSNITLEKGIEDLMANLEYVLNVVYKSKCISKFFLDYSNRALDHLMLSVQPG